MTSYSDAIRAGDVIDFCDLIWRKSVGDLAAPTVATREPTKRTEEWRPVPGYEGFYEVSNFGRVKGVDRVLSYDRNGTPVLRKQRGKLIGQRSTSGDCYARVLLRREGKQRTLTVHRLVGCAFLGHMRNALHNEVAHLDGTRTNSHADNLKWVSKSENRTHRKLHGTHNAGSAAWNAKLTEGQVVEIKRDLKQGRPTRELANEHGVSFGCIESIRRGRNWRHVSADGVSTIARGAGEHDRRRP